MTVLRYSLLRLMLLLGVLLALWLLGGVVTPLRDPVLLVVFTVIVSVVLSYYVLRAPREAMTARLAERVSGRLPHDTRGTDHDADAEDAEVQAAAAPSAQGQTEAEQDAEGELGASGVAQDGDESQPGGAGGDDAPRRPQQDG